MRVKLKKIATIATGLYEKRYPEGDVFYLQLKHFDEYGKFSLDDTFVPDVLMDDRVGKHVLEDKDLLVVAKGESNRVCLYRESIGQAIASSVFFVVRLEGKEVEPEYLQWYLNTVKMQKELTNRTKGTHILSLSKKALSEVEVEVPPVGTQRQIIALTNLHQREKAISQELIELKDIYIEKRILDKIK